MAWMIRIVLHVGPMNEFVVRVCTAARFTEQEDHFHFAIGKGLFDSHWHTGIGEV